jgi:leader peptidase (prepilin peptidase)/N-methyltransferase
VSLFCCAPDALFWTALTAILGAVLLRLSWIDRREFRLPDRYTLPLIVAGLLLAAAGIGAGILSAAAAALLGFGLFWIIGHWHFEKRGAEGLGLGDAKLFAAAGAWVGLAGLPYVLLIASAGGLMMAALRGRSSRPAGIAFGPWLALGFWVVWIAQRAASSG